MHVADNGKSFHFEARCFRMGDNYFVVNADKDLPDLYIKLSASKKGKTYPSLAAHHAKLCPKDMTIEQKVEKAGEIRMRMIESLTKNGVPKDIASRTLDDYLKTVAPLMVVD